MKLGPILLLNVLIAGSAVFSYHMIAGPEAKDDNSGYEAPMSGEFEVDEPEVATQEPALRGVGDEVYRDKVMSLETEVASLKALLAKITVKSTRPTADGTTSTGGPTAALELPVVEEGEENPEFDDATLRSLRAMMEQVEQQRRQERIEQGLQRQLDRLGVELSDDQEKAVIQATVGFRDKTRNMWRNLPRGGDDEAREKRREAMDTMREEYSKTVYSLVPAESAEKIVNSMGRGMGFSSRGDMGGRRGGDNNRRGR